MYRLNIYQDFNHGEFKLLETYQTYANDRDEAKSIAMKYAIDKYPDIKVRIINVN